MTSINDSGGEFELIKRLSALVPAQGSGVLVGIGDDAAVLETGHDQALLLATTDMMVAGNHFDMRLSSPEQIGVKAAESNVSDIAAMGGTPTAMFVSIALPQDTEIQWVEDLYRGISRSCEKHQMTVAGGDTTQGALVVISVTLLGRVRRDHLCLRSHARAGDLIGVTGTLGASGAGLMLMRRELPVSAYLRQKHLAPTCRMDVSPTLAPLVHAMIDVSDGLASEVNHICDQSRVGAVVREADISLHPDVRDAGSRLGVDPLQFALNGGEDYELVFTVAPDRLDELRASRANFFIVGKILDADAGRLLIRRSGTAETLKGGYNHFDSL